MTTIKFSYKTSDFDTSGYLYDNDIYFTDIVTFPLYNNFTDLKIIGRGLLVDNVLNTNTNGVVNEIGSYFIDNLENINGYDIFGYIYSFRNSTSFFVPGQIINIPIVFGTSIDNGKTGSVTINVIDDILRIVTIVIND